MTRIRRLGLFLDVAVPLSAFLAFASVLVVRASERIDGTLWFVLADDEMISMRYARNLASGHGLLWNPGEPPVEGYSNFLWTLWMAFLHLLSLPESKLSLAVMGSGVLALGVTLVVMPALIAHVVPRRSRAVFAALLLTALSYPLVYWTVRGFEVSVGALGVVVLALLTLRYERSAATRDLVFLTSIGSSLALVRDDLVVLSIVAFGYLIVVCPRRRPLLFFAAGIAAVVGLHTAFRIAYYGHPLPNTYYLKIGGVDLPVRLGRGMEALAGTWGLQLYVMLALAISGVMFSRGPARRAATLLASMVASTALFSAYAGGDAWELFEFPNRYVATTLPLLYVLAAAGLVAVVSFSEIRRTALGVVVATGVGCALALLGSRAPFLPDQVAPPIWAADIHPLPGDVRASLVRGLLLVGACAAILGGAFLARKTRTSTAVAVTAALLAVVSGGEQALRQGGLAQFYEQNDITQARMGLRIRELLPRSVTVAATHAGAMPYLARQPFVDLLGKNDPVIARSKPVRPFLPGHNKFDLAYSVGTLRPDFVVDVGPQDVEIIVARFGYLRQHDDDPAYAGLLPGGGILVRSQ